jgi:hypothetical protein
MKPILVATLLALLALAAWRHAAAGGILFYQGIAIAAVAGIGLALALRLRGADGRTTPLKDGLLTFLIVYAFVFTVPTTVDRSYSVRMLQKLDASSSGLTRDELTGFFMRDFIAEGGVDRRLREQTRTGTIVPLGERWQLTPEGHWLNRAFEATCAAFVCESR